MKFTLEYIANHTQGKLNSDADKNREIEGFYSDSRFPDESKMFLGLRGERVDGNSFAPDMLAKGFAVLTDREENLSCGGDCIYVKDVRNALQKLSCYYRSTALKNVSVIGVTGSVGKTTTKDMVALAISSAFSVHKTAGNSNSQIGVPQTILDTPENIDCAVVELGMSMPGEMEKIARCAVPDISLITNIGYSHIENLGSREAIRNEKIKISASSPEDSWMILNGDEPLLRDYNFGKKRVCYVSLNDTTCQCYAKDVLEIENGISFTAVIYGKPINVSLNVIGTHFVLNSLFALAVAHCLEIDLQSAAANLAEYASDGKRQNIYCKDGHTIISDCYNAAPESMKAALSVLKTYKGRRIAVLGDMLELGSESELLHKRVGEQVKESADVLVTYGTYAKFIGAELQGIEKYSFEKEEYVELKLFLESFIKETDIVLYKASNGMNLGRVIV